MGKQKESSLARRGEQRCDWMALPVVRYRMKPIELSISILGLLAGTPLSLRLDLRTHAMIHALTPRPVLIVVFPFPYNINASVHTPTRWMEYTTVRVAMHALQAMCGPVGSGATSRHAATIRRPCT